MCDRKRGHIQDEVLEVVCPLPTAADARLFHQDLSEMSGAERWRERERIRLRLLLDPDPALWLLERLDAPEVVMGGDDHAH